MACGTPPRPPRPDGGARPGTPAATGLALHTPSGDVSLDRVVVVGVLNATPDSFSDGGRYLDPERAAAEAQAMVAAGARLLDLGAESTRPGAVPVPADEERRRLLPVLRAVRAAVCVPLSVDTTKADVAEAALGEGADLVNDVSAGRDAGMLSLCARTGVPVVLMHVRGGPDHMLRPRPAEDVVGEVTAALRERARAAEDAGVRPDAIVLDPGIGFGKTVVDNCRLLRRLDRLVALGYPVLVGVSRKSFLGHILGGRPVGERLHATTAAVALAVAGGARLVRVHDVDAMRDVVAVAEAVSRA